MLSFEKKLLLKNPRKISFISRQKLIAANDHSVGKYEADNKNNQGYYPPNPHKAFILLKNNVNTIYLYPGVTFMKDFQRINS